jgi:hypothetical protein
MVFYTIQYNVVFLGIVSCGVGLMKYRFFAATLVLALLFVSAAQGGTFFSDFFESEPPKTATWPEDWNSEWPDTDFSKHTNPYDEIQSGGVPKDAIPAIDHPEFLPASKISNLLGEESVLAFSIGDDIRAYPLRVLIWHEIVNDVVGGLPVTVTYCPLCNSSIVFDRNVDGRTLDFGTTGKLRNSDLVMYDRQTKSWWQQFLGEALIGEMAGKRLKMLPSRLESFALFKERAPEGLVLVPGNPRMRNYGINPYAGYDRMQRPPMYAGEMPQGISPMVRVVVIGNEAWSLELLRQKKVIERDGLILRWTAGRASALDARTVSHGRDIGNIVVERYRGESLEPVVHDVVFAFVFHAFHPKGTLHTP